MKELSLEKMEEIEAGNGWDCIGGAVAMGTLLGIGLSAAFGNPFAIGLLVSPQGQWAAANLFAGGIIATSACFSGE